MTNPASPYNRAPIAGSSRPAPAPVRDPDNRVPDNHPVPIGYSTPPKLRGRDPRHENALCPDGLNFLPADRHGGFPAEYLIVQVLVWRKDR